MRVLFTKNIKQGKLVILADNHEYVLRLQTERGKKEIARIDGADSERVKSLLDFTKEI